MPIIAPSSRPAVLALSDGTVFRGQAIGSPGITTGTLTFHTSITGYQELLTTPASFNQIITMTYPMIGNVGVNDDDVESARVWASGLVIRALPVRSSSWRQTETFSNWLESMKTVAIAGVDTRAITNIVREKGMLGACIVAGNAVGEILDEADAIAKAKACAGLDGQDVSMAVSTKLPYTWTEGGWTLEGFTKPAVDKGHLCVVDCGLTRSLLRAFVDRGYRITVLPASSSAEKILEKAPDGVIFSDGPGDPRAARTLIETARELIDRHVPTLGVGVGHLICAIASGASVSPLKVGHHGVNHPIRFSEGFSTVSKQNIGYMIDSESLPANLTADQTSLFDDSVTGLAWPERNLLTTAGFPDALSAPRGTTHLFDRFTAMLD